MFRLPLHLPRTAVVTAAGQDGERLVTDEMVERAARAVAVAADDRGHFAVEGGRSAAKSAARAALTVVAADLDRGGYDRGRADGAAEERERIAAVEREARRYSGRIRAYVDRGECGYPLGGLKPGTCRLPYGHDDGPRRTDHVSDGRPS